MRDEGLNDLRLIVAQLAEDHLAEKISFKEFEQTIPEGAFEDSDIYRLVEEIRHLPKIRGFFGVSKTYFAQYKEENVDPWIRRLKEELPPAKPD